MARFESFERKPYHVVGGNHSALACGVGGQPPVGVLGGVLDSQEVALLKGKILRINTKYTGLRRWWWLWAMRRQK
jgi:hypothetical protein